MKESCTKASLRSSSQSVKSSVELALLKQDRSELLIWLENVTYFKTQQCVCDEMKVNCFAEI